MVCAIERKTANLLSTLLAPEWKKSPQIDPSAYHACILTTGRAVEVQIYGGDYANGVTQVCCTKHE